MALGDAAVSDTPVTVEDASTPLEPEAEEVDDQPSLGACRFIDE